MTAKENILFAPVLPRHFRAEGPGAFEALARQLDILDVLEKFPVSNVRRTEAESSSGKGADRKSPDPFGR